MKIILSIAALLLAAPALLAQPTALRVEAKRPHTYDTRIAITSTQSIMGQEISMKLDAIGIAELVPTAVASTSIDWTVGFPALSIKAESAMLGSMDTTVRIAPEPLRSGTDGRVGPGAGVSTGDAQITLMLQQGLGANFWGQFFSPTITAKAKVGGTWEESIRDTVGEKAMGLSIRRAATTRYAFEALVDTLGTRAMRVRTTVPTMTIDGELSAQGMPLSLSGDGSTSGTFYYDAATGMLLAGGLDSEVSINATLDAGTKMVVPITIATSYSMARNAGGGK